MDENNNPFEINARHCDDYIRDKTQPMCLRKFLLYHRIPAVWRFTRWKKTWGQPTLFAYYKNRRVRVTMASRFGDVGITTKLGLERGYDTRVSVSDLEDFCDKMRVS